ncbi:hypothetical protein BDZ45DRAFT_270334 [Acephala macrosclerotiorum]|nr:hypothetical protein BDZ45DRAFT_270334 [Acephala macrosclerotiorum]
MRIYWLALITGQSIPFVIGVFSFPTTLWGILKNNRGKAQKGNVRKDDSELDMPLKNLTFADTGLESQSGVYTSLNLRLDEQHDDFDIRPGNAEMREARNF